MIRRHPMLLSLILVVLAASSSRTTIIAAAQVEWQADSWDVFQTEAAAKFGKPGAAAAAFLAANHPARDAALDPQLLLEHLEFALRARQEFQWASRLSDEMFLNDVLPYAVIDESRERWRPVLYQLSREIIKDATTAAEAAQSLNRDLFKKANVRYSTERAKPNQSAMESMKSGTASCTGLSILLVKACRAVGIPARITGIASWPDREGNHTWVEIWDGTQWRYTGAAEYDVNGLDRAWFASPASHAIEGHDRHAIWVTSWKATGRHFPLAWSPTDHSVPGIDVTSRYVRDSPASADAAPTIAVRLWESRGGKRVAARTTIEVDEKVHQATTFADPDDINRVAEFNVDLDEPRRIELTCNGESRLAWIHNTDQPRRIVELYWNELSLTRESAEQAVAKLWEEHVAAHHAERKAELDAMVIRDGEHNLRLLKREFGHAPANGHSLWISMHGGGGAPADVNEQQWKNQARLYELDEGIYIAPRAPSNEWNLWHRAEIDRLFARLIESAVMVWGVDPDRVYLMGYSAGGDGVYQLAPRMADRFAAAAMMAGHPNDASPLGLRNLPFAIFMGGKDAAYNRNEVAQQWQEHLKALQQEDPSGYPHRVDIYPECGHWMQGKDVEAIPWMAVQKRNPWPKRVVWRQGGVTHTRFYWLAIDPKDASPGRLVNATVHGQTIEITCDDKFEIELLLRDELIDLDQPIQVIANGTMVFEGRVPRSVDVIRKTLADRADPRCAATAGLQIVVPQPPTQPLE